jgi:hypothetical protein
MIIQNYFPGVERHAGDIDVPEGGTISLFYYPSKSKSLPLPGWGVYIEWCIN